MLAVCVLSKTDPDSHNINMPCTTILSTFRMNREPKNILFGLENRTSRCKKALSCKMKASRQENSTLRLVKQTLRLEIGTLRLSYPIHLRFSSEVPDVRSDQIRSTDPYQIRHDKLLHSYPVHITLNTAYFLHLVYPPFWYISYAYFRLCFTDPFTCD